MLNTLTNNNNKTKLQLENIQEEIFLLPKWEKIKSFMVLNNIFLFGKSTTKINLFRRFSSKNSIEKYCIKFSDNKLIANMDLKIYKDCVYIINLDVKILSETAVEKLIQTALEKALYNTENKEVFINLSSDTAKRNRIKKLLINNGFETTQEQSDYEKEMFGETFTLTVENNTSWIKKIKQMPILINK